MEDALYHFGAVSSLMAVIFLACILVSRQRRNFWIGVVSQKTLFS
jgi:hypothetical protein